MPTTAGNYSTELRRDLLGRAKMYAEKRELQSHVYRSLGTPPTTLFRPYEEEDVYLHGNFFPKSYAGILAAPSWSERLAKKHSQKTRALREEDRANAKELDSCTSSDALLMNVFCHPCSLASKTLASLFGFQQLPQPEFGFKARLPMAAGGNEPRSTEIDLRLHDTGRTVLIEAKLTERTFTERSKLHVESYKGFAHVIAPERLPERNGKYLHYQLIRNVLAAHVYDASFCLLCDQRRLDLQAAWAEVADAIAVPNLRARCSLVTWQQVAGTLPADLRLFLAEKYGIVP